MAQYIIYGKGTERWFSKCHQRWFEPDKTFKALDYKGCRVSKIADAGFYDTKEEAQAVLDKVGEKPGRVFEIRKAKQCDISDKIWYGKIQCLMFLKN